MTIDEVFYNHHRVYGKNRPDILKIAVKTEIKRQLEDYFGKDESSGKTCTCGSCMYREQLEIRFFGARLP